MHLPQFEYLAPRSLEEALDLLSVHQEDAKILAGGTDLLVRMKKGLLHPRFLISLKALDELSYVSQRDGTIAIGAKTPLADIIASDTVKKGAAALWQACEKIGAVTIQHYRGTLGGNILQDNRCHHYNQSIFHRSGRQACHKDGGKICYAREVSDRCNSTCQSDGATALMALKAVLVLAAKSGERTVDLADFYTNDGIMPFAIKPHELLKEIRIPMSGGQSAYRRIAYRSAIDYPLVSAGVWIQPDPGRKGVMGAARIVVGAMGRAPLFMVQASATLTGKRFDDNDAFRKVADAARESASPFAVHNVGSTPEYRCAMAGEMVLRALNDAAGSLNADS